MNAVNNETHKDELRKFGLITGGLLVGLFGLALPLVFGRHLTLWPWIIGGILAVLALALPAVLAPIYKYWMRFAHVLGWINTRILLSLVFFLLITPFGFLMRLLGRDPMARKFDKIATSYRVASTTAPRGNLKRPF
jgi:hypothetical protein